MRKINIKEFIYNLLAEIFVDKYNCIACDAELREPSKYGLCEQCKSKLTFIQSRVCKKCGRLQVNEADYCMTCQEHKREFDFARSCVVYDDVAKEIVRGIKFGGKKYFAKYIANFLVEKYQSAFDGVNIDVVIPVPLTKKKKSARGYNQSWEIAKAFAKAVDLTADESIVVKIKDTKEQARLSGAEREENTIGAFEVKYAEKVKDKIILIVDDVMTTGSTASEIAKMLKKAKAKEVYLLTFSSTKYKVEGESNENKVV
ncbi:MAG: ComF family protein [Clostridia bacterium]|nr:ComF family protein [Clostridia bacterium]